MKVRPHCELLSKQFLLATQKPNHPNRVNLSAPPPPRQMSKTLSSRFGAEIRQMSRPDPPEEDYKSKLKLIHNKSVQEALNAMEPNKVLLAKPPPIHSSERCLPRATRTTLAQLRSSYSTYLNSYKARIDPSVQDICPNCNNHSHTTRHLFNCPNNITNLTARDLWTRPLEAARFLNLATEVNDDSG